LFSLKKKGRLNEPSKGVKKPKKDVKEINQTRIFKKLTKQGFLRN